MHCISACVARSNGMIHGMYKFSEQLSHRERSTTLKTCRALQPTPHHGARASFSIKLQKGSGSHCSVEQCGSRGCGQHNSLPTLRQYEHTQFAARGWPQIVHSTFRTWLSWIQFDLCNWCMHCNTCTALHNMHA